MDIYGIETLLGLPEFHVLHQIIGPKRLDMHLERRASTIVCPRLPDVLLASAGESASVHS